MSNIWWARRCVQFVDFIVLFEGLDQNLPVLFRMVPPPPGQISRPMPPSRQGAVIRCSAVERLHSRSGNWPTAWCLNIEVRNPPLSANLADCTLRRDVLQDSRPATADSGLALDKSTPAADRLTG